MTFRKWFNEFIAEYDFSDLYQTETSEYFKGITTAGTDYWNVHLDMLEEYGIDDADKDIKILDIGVWFGVWPFALQQYGFKNVHTTECAAHSQAKQSSFQVLHPHFGVEPTELHILPKVPFDFGQKFDLITVMKSNMFWKTNDVIKYDGTTVTTEWQVPGADGNIHTFFTLYTPDDWEFFINNIRQCLNPGGQALINPEPWCYDRIETLAETKQYLEQYKQTTFDYGDLLQNFLVITA